MIALDYFQLENSFVPFFLSFLYFFLSSFLISYFSHIFQKVCVFGTMSKRNTGPWEQFLGLGGAELSWQAKKRRRRKKVLASHQGYCGGAELSWADKQKKEKSPPIPPGVLWGCWAELTSKKKKEKRSSPPTPRIFHPQHPRLPGAWRNNWFSVAF